jgi:preprotein translocase subunit SecE
MTEQTDNKAGGGALDALWLVLSVALLVGGLVGYYLLAGRPTPLRFATVLAGVATAVGAFWMTSWGRSAWEFILGSRVELRKMVWPTVPDTRKTTLVVFLFVALGGVFFWIVDWLLAWGTRHLLGTGA